jgi:hypothetical protein
MDTLLPFLPALACPVVMSGMMWLMMRGQRAAPADGGASVAKPAPEPVRFHLCLDWRVVSALAGIAFVVWLLSPGLLIPTLLVVVTLACPLSMLLMLGSMRSSRAPNQVIDEQPAAASQVPAE